MALELNSTLSALTQSEDIIQELKKNNANCNYTIQLNKACISLQTNLETRTKACKFWVVIVRNLEMS